MTRPQPDLYVVTITCSRCLGKGVVDVYTPRSRAPDNGPCPECRGKGTIKVYTPTPPEVTK